MRSAICVGVLLACGLASAALAQESVEFDARRLFSCAEVKPPQQADVARKVIVVVIPISANFNVAEKTVESLRYELRLPKSVTVLDHLPKTQTGTNVITQTEDTEKKQRTGVKVKVSGERAHQPQLSWGGRERGRRGRADDGGYCRGEDESQSRSPTGP